MTADIILCAFANYFHGEVYYLATCVIALLNLARVYYVASAMHIKDYNTLAILKPHDILLKVKPENYT